MSFRVGQKVVCVDGTPGCKGVYPIQGRIYTIAWCGMFFHPLFLTNELSVHLVEIKRPPGNRTGCVVPYRASRFRPVVERKTDISIFTKLLTPTTREAENA